MFINDTKILNLIDYKKLITLLGIIIYKIRDKNYYFDKWNFTFLLDFKIFLK